MASLVNKDKPYKIIYSFHSINILGMSISLYAVQLSRQGKFSYRHQKISSMNVRDFTDDKLIIEHIKLIEEISLMSIYERYSTKNSNIADFFKNLQNNKAKQKIIRSFIDKQIGIILNDLKLQEDPLLFLSSKDGYPAYKKLKFAEETASIVALIKKGSKGVFYSMRLKYKNKFLKLCDKNKNISSQIIIYRENPAVVIDNTIFFLQEDSAIKLKPFTNNEFVFYEGRSEQLFMTKVLPDLLNKYEVRLRNFKLSEIKKEPVFILDIQFLTKTKLTVFPKVKYGDDVFNLNENKASITKYIQEKDEQPEFIITHRNPEKEKPFKEFWNKYFNNTNSWYSTVDIYDFILWMEQNKQTIDDLNIQLKINKYGKNEVLLTIPELKISIEEKEDKILLDAFLEYNTGNNKYSVNILQLNPKKIDNFFEIDDKYLIIPDNIKIYIDWLLNTSKIIDNKLKIQPYQISIVEHLLKEKLHKKELSEETLALPKGINATLRPYQMAGFQWLMFLKHHNYGGILADEMGLGKTLQTITLLQKVKETTPANLTSLIVVPNALISNWQREFEKFAPEITTNIYHGYKRKKLLQDFYKYDVWITTYGTMRADIEELKEFMFHYVILDESHYIKNKDAQVSKAAFQLKAHHRLALTGTPLENNLAELWAQMNFINPNMLGNFNFFKKYFIEPIEKNNNEKRLDALTKVISPFILRRTKQQVLKDLPPKMENVIMCDMLPEQRKLYYENAAYFQLKLTKLIEDPKARMQILAYLQRLRQIAIHPKLINPAINQSGKYEVLKNLIEEIIANNSKALIFSHYVKTLNLIRILLDKQKIKYAYIDGKTKDRQKQVDYFNESQDVNLFLISIKAGGVGLNLPTADTVILLDPWWNPAIEDQAVSRAHRIGQKNVLNVYKLITKDSIEEKILKLQNNKKELFQKVLKNELSILKQLSLEELKQLITIPEKTLV